MGWELNRESFVGNYVLQLPTIGHVSYSGMVGETALVSKELGFVILYGDLRDEIDRILEDKGEDGLQNWFVEEEGR